VKKRYGPTFTGEVYWGYVGNGVGRERERGGLRAPGAEVSPSQRPRKVFIHTIPSKPGKSRIKLYLFNRRFEHLQLPRVSTNTRSSDKK
jgi:hypothetical protein